MRRVTKHDLVVDGFDWAPSGRGLCNLRSSSAGRRSRGHQLAGILPVRSMVAPNSTERGLDRPVGGFMSSDMRSGTGELLPRFSPDGSTVYFLVTNEGSVQVYSVPLAGGEVRQVVGGARQVLNFGVAKNGIAFAASTATNPNDLFFADFNGINERRLTNVNEDILFTLELSEPQEFWLERPDGARVQGWIMLPPGYSEDEKYPLMLQVHGGPHMSFGKVYFHEFQATAARG